MTPHKLDIPVNKLNFSHWEKKLLYETVSHYENTLNASDVSEEIEHVQSIERAHADIVMAAVTSIACALRTVFAISVKRVEYRENQENIVLYSRANYLYGKKIFYRFRRSMYDEDMSRILGSDYRITEHGEIPVGLHISMVTHNGISKMDLVLLQTHMILWVEKINPHPCLHITL